MIIKKEVTKEELLKEVKGVNKGEDLEEVLVVEDDEAESKKYKYHIYGRNDNGTYRLVNYKPFDINLRDGDKIRWIGEPLGNYVNIVAKRNKTKLEGLKSFYGVDSVSDLTEEEVEEFFRDK